jgi:hypothetical protein
MPNYLVAKDICEMALQEIGAFSPQDSQADAGELIIALRRLEVMLNDEIGSSVLAGYFRTFDIPLAVSGRSYPVKDFADKDMLERIFSIHVVEKSNLSVSDVVLVDEEKYNALSWLDTGTPNTVFIDKDVLPTIYVYPVLGNGVADGDFYLRIRCQTYAPPIAMMGDGKTNINLRPSWYLWAYTKLAYLLGRGAVRRIPEQELNRLQRDYTIYENRLIANDGQHDTGRGAMTEAGVM